MKMVAHVINRHSQGKIGFISPYGKLWNVKPTVSYFSIFGCVHYIFMPNHLRSKIDKKVIRCILSGKTTRENDGGVMILPIDDATQHET